MFPFFRFLSYLPVVLRIVEQWGALNLFFTHEAHEEKVRAAEYILRDMRDPQTKLYLLFLKWVLPRFHDLNKFFQGEESLITVVHAKMTETYLAFLGDYMDASYVKRTDPHLIDPRDTTRFVHIRNVFLGGELQEELQVLERNPANRDLVNDVRERCRNFLIVASVGMRKRYDFRGTNPYALMSCLNADIALSTDPRRPPSLGPLAAAITSDFTQRRWSAPKQNRRSVEGTSVCILPEGVAPGEARSLVGFHR